MITLKVRNVNEALERGIDLFCFPDNYIEQDSRNGKTLELNEPLTTVYQNPWERVLFCTKRDANPFFHFIESLWMLNGNNDLAPLTYFVKSMKDFSDDGRTLNAAYGNRWRSYFGEDQIEQIIDILTKNPDDRRAVLQMWGIKDLADKSLDVPCNTNIYFKIRNGKLNMTVCNRSNDMVWGAYGANAVHMSILQEYIALAIGVDVGVYTQISDSLHVYENKVWDRIKGAELDPLTYRHLSSDYCDGYEYSPLYTDKEIFDKELRIFFSPFNLWWLEIDDEQRLMREEKKIDLSNYNFNEPTFKDIAMPMVKAFSAHKERDYDKAYEYVSKITAQDWMVACFNWITKRDKLHNLNNK